MRACSMRAFTLACLIAATLLILTSIQPLETSTVVPTPVVAVCISGALRGPAALRAFAAALETHLMEPARRARNARFELFGWLQDDPAAERLLAQLLPSVVTRRTAGNALPPELALDEDTAIRTEHGHVVSVGPLTDGKNLTNTLRMLRKMRGCEWLRQRQQARSVQPHALVVKIRPDLLLLEPLSLPLDAPPPPDRAWAWHCAEQRVTSDQLLVGGPALAVGWESSTCRPRCAPRRIGRSRRAPTRSGSYGSTSCRCTASGSSRCRAALRSSPTAAARAPHSPSCEETSGRPSARTRPPIGQRWICARR